MASPNRVKQVLDKFKQSDLGINFFYPFLGVHIIVALRGEAEEPLLGKEGSYYIPTQPYSNFNGKPYWIQKNGNNGIWYSGILI